MRGTNLDVLQMKRKGLVKELKSATTQRNGIAEQLRETTLAMRKYEEKALKKKTGVELYRAGDYAGLSVGRYKFYYGYEKTVGEEWAFTADIDDKEVMRIPASKLGGSGMDMPMCLLHGIGQFLASRTERT